MLKKSITYTNPFTEQEVTEDHYFHISKADLVEMEMEEHGATYQKDGKTLTGMQAKLQRIIDSEDGKAIIVELKDMVRRSYGKKVGDRFIKNDENWQEFASSEAFSQLLFELCTDAEASAQFMNGLVPHDLDQEAVKIATQAQAAPTGADDRESADIAARIQGETAAKVRAMTPEEARQLTILNATSEDPVTLTQAELTTMDMSEVRLGFASGKFKV